MVVLYNQRIIFRRGMKRRDLLLRRYWRREDDGTYGSIEMEDIFCFLYLHLIANVLMHKLTSFGFFCHSYSVPFCVS